MNLTRASRILLRMRRVLAVASAAVLFLCGFIASDVAATVGSRSDAPCPDVQLPLSPSEARCVAAQARSTWLQEINRRGKRGRANPHPAHFRSPSRALFLTRLRKAARQYDFEVLGVHFYRPLQLAPYVIARSVRPKRLSRDMFKIERLLDPLNTRSTLATAWAYEGFLFEGRDAQGVPAFGTFNSVRGGIYGGQWARSESLYPFGHG